MDFSHFTSSVVCIWLASWAFRQKYETDYPLNNIGKGLRWTVVFAGLAIAVYLKGAQFGAVRLAAATIGMAFLCWPNFSFHIVNRFRRKDAESSIESDLR